MKVYISPSNRAIVKINDFELCIKEELMELPVLLLENTTFKKFDDGLAFELTDLDRKHTAGFFSDLYLFKDSGTLKVTFGYNLQQKHCKNRKFISLLVAKLQTIETYTIRQDDVGLLVHINVIDMPFLDFLDSASNDLADIIKLVEDEISKTFDWKSMHFTNETYFCEDVITPLLQRIGFTDLVYRCGPREYGKDFTFTELSKFNSPRRYALQAKPGDVSGEVNSQIDAIIGQIDVAFSMPYKNTGSISDLYISEMIIAISGHFTDNAKEKILHKVEPYHKGSLHFWDREKFDELILQYW